MREHKNQFEALDIVTDSYAIKYFKYDIKKIDGNKEQLHLYVDVFCENDIPKVDFYFFQHGIDLSAKYNIIPNKEAFTRYKWIVDLYDRSTLSVEVYDDELKKLSDVRDVLLKGNILFCETDEFRVQYIGHKSVIYDEEDTTLIVALEFYNKCNIPVSPYISHNIALIAKQNNRELDFGFAHDVNAYNYSDNIQPHKSNILFFTFALDKNNTSDVELELQLDGIHLLWQTININFENGK